MLALHQWFSNLGALQCPLEIVEMQIPGTSSGDSIQDVQRRSPGIGVLLPLCVRSMGDSDTQPGSSTTTGLDDIALGDRERRLWTPVDGIGNLCLGQTLFSL